MEDSEQRKKRLKEMRSQADQAEVSGGIEGSGVPGILSNPLIKAPSTTPSWDKSYAAPRFDYYTDPMSAFSSNKRSNANIQVAQEYFPPPNFGGSPMAQFSSPHPASSVSRSQSDVVRIMSPPFGDHVEDKLVNWRGLFVIVIKANWLKFKKKR
ncbi:protein SICKLE-like isoform X2 [Gastrolobium bilobum]|nr:protein SICKLE-like isoform X2 [Gastrolobium bilobum]